MTEYSSKYQKHSESNIWFEKKSHINKGLKVTLIYR
jgi:hypothetical protein